MTSYFPVAKGGKGPYANKILADEPVMKEIAEKHGKSTYQVALRWGMQKGHIVIPKTANLGRL